MTRTFTLALATFLLAAAPAAGQPDRVPPLADVGIDQRLEAQVPLDAVFRDEEGREVSLGKFFDGKPVVLTLVYHRCPKLCGTILTKVVEGLRKIPYDAGKDFHIVTVSFDHREGPELAAQRKQFFV